MLAEWFLNSFTFAFYFIHNLIPVQFVIIDVITFALFLLVLTRLADF